MLLNEYDREVVKTQTGRETLNHTHDREVV